MDISITLEQDRGPDWVEEFFDGTRTGEGEEYFPVGKRIQNVRQGDFLYLVHQGLIVGRLLITKIDYDEKTLPVGAEGRPIAAKTVVWVKCPGERAGQRKMSRNSQRGFRYDDVPEWGG
jgi:hypothetical protein